MRFILFCLFLIIAFQLKAQECNDSNHSANINDSWISCDVGLNPNKTRGNSHWVMYDLGYVYSLGNTRFWNYNENGETDKGMKNIVIDYSINGTDWTEVTSFQLSEASGDVNYEGENGPHLGDIDARYVLITSIDTWGDDCAGLSEVRFDIEGTVSINGIPQKNHSIKIFPNPANQNISILTEMKIKEFVIISNTGHEIVRLPYALNIDISFLPDGIYFLKSIDRNNKIYIDKFVKLHP